MKFDRELISNGNPMEAVVGFSRAVRVSPFISVGGTAPVCPDGKTVGVGDVAAQTRPRRDPGRGPGRGNVSRLSRPRRNRQARDFTMWSGPGSSSPISTPGKRPSTSARTISGHSSRRHDHGDRSFREPGMAGRTGSGCGYPGLAGLACSGRQKKTRLRRAGFSASTVNSLSAPAGESIRPWKRQRAGTGAFSCRDLPCS